MTATPTPGDLSARLPELPEPELMTIKGRAFTATQMYLFAIKVRDAALSALPAAGGEVGEVTGTYGGRGMALVDLDKCPVGSKLYTTPQPSAADHPDALPDGTFSKSVMKRLHVLQPSAATPELLDIAKRARNLVMQICEEASFPIPQTFIDAADAAIAKATIPQPSAAEEGAVTCRVLTFDGERIAVPSRIYRRVHDALLGAALDAAVGAQGDGCDCGCNEPAFTEPMEALRFLSGRMKHAGIGESVALSYARDIDRILAAPAAGKGVDFDAWHDAKWPEPEIYHHKVSWRWEKDKRREAWQAALTRQPVAGDGKWFGPDASGGYYVKRRAEEWFYARPQTMVAPDQLAAPAATPTDGGEGRS